MQHRLLLESYLKQKKKLNYEKEEATRKGQCIFKKIELFLDSYEEEVMKITRQETHNLTRRGSDSTGSSNSCITCSSIADRNMIEFDRAQATSRSPPLPRGNSKQKKSVSFGLPCSTVKESQELDKKRGSSRREIKGILRNNSFIYKQSLANNCNKSLFLNEGS